MSLINNTQTAASQDLESQLDSQIQHIRKEIAKLRSQKQRLSSSLLGSSRIQKQLFTRKPTTPEADTALNSKLDELQSKVGTEKEINDIKIHRLAYGVTAFPFTDDAPERRDQNGQSQTMLGLRFDLHPSRAEIDGSTRGERDEEVNTYFLILRKIMYEGGLYLKVHQHSIPAHISVESLAERYLPLPEVLLSGDEWADREGDAASFHDDSGIDVTQDIVQPHLRGSAGGVVGQSSVENTGQDLHAFTRTVHAHLRAWQYRMQAVYLVRREVEARPELGVQSVKCTNDGRQVTIAWSSDNLALVKVGFDGVVETVIAYGSADPMGEDREDGENERHGESVRLFGVERKLGRTESGGKVMISKLVERLEAVEKCFDS